MCIRDRSPSATWVLLRTCFKTSAEQGDYTRESVAFTVADEYNTLMQPDSQNPQPTAPGWEYKPNSPTSSTFEAPAEPAPAAQPAVPEASISWSASEFVAHHKSAGWYAILFGGAALVGALIY